jgi:hypothetical protein
MTRQELLRIVIRQARTNGFRSASGFRPRSTPPGPALTTRWSCLPKGGATTLSFLPTNLPGRSGSRVLRSASSFPAASYTRRDKEGRIVTVTRKPFTRRTLKADVWKYHLREMAATTSRSDTFDVSSL